MFHMVNIFLFKKVMKSQQVKKLLMVQLIHTIFLKLRVQMQFKSIL